MQNCVKKDVNLRSLNVYNLKAPTNSSMAITNLINVINYESKNCSDYASATTYVHVVIETSLN